jgi:D-arabinose 5-phosphate isomerase GutQ
MLDGRNEEMEPGIKVAARAFQIESSCLAEAFSHIDPDAFLAAVDALAGAERIAASGCGHSGIACQHFAHLMCCIERPARFISPSEAVHGALGYLKAGDVMLLVSRGGMTEELLPIQVICQKKHVIVIVATERPNSALAKAADVVLMTFLTQETDRFNAQGTTSFTVQNVLFDALQAALIEKNGFDNSHFALIHPGGAVGARLNRN